MVLWGFSKAVLSALWKPIFYFLLSPLLRVYNWFGDQVLFRFLLPRTYLYNAMVEDPRLDIRELKLVKEDHVLTIASAGCNSFDYLLEGCRVTAADINPAQIALVQLKVACALALSYDLFFRIFGSGDLSTLRLIWWDKQSGLRDHSKISDPSRAFWDRELPQNCLQWAWKGLFDHHLLYYTGGSGVLSRGFQTTLWCVGLLDFCRAGCAGLPFPPGQAKTQDCLGMKMMGWVYMALSPIVNALQGVPANQYNLGQKAIPNLVVIGLQRLFNCCCFGQLKPPVPGTPRPADLPSGNYFYHAFLFGRYRDQISCPRYLQPQFFPKFKEALENNRFTLVPGTFEEAAKQAIARGSGFTAFSLLDSMDWMPPEVATSILTVVFAATSPDVPYARVFWRSLGPSVHVPALLYTFPRLVDDSEDRVGSYFSTWVGTLPTLSRNAKNGSSTLVTQHPIISELAQPFGGLVSPKHLGRVKKAAAMAKTGIQIATFPIRARNVPQDPSVRMDAFYESQKESYDLFRESLLVARPLLMHCVRATIARLVAIAQSEKKESDKALLNWVDIGGGTLRNLEYLGSDFIRRHMHRIWVLDVSSALLSKAHERVRVMGLEDVVRLVQVDVTSDLPTEVATSLTPQSVHLVTMSYSLSMIKPHETVLERAIEWLIPGGVLAISDLTTRDKQKSSDKFARWWFKQDGIDLDPALRLSFAKHPAFETPLFFSQWAQRTWGAPFVIPHHYVAIAFRRNVDIHEDVKEGKLTKVASKSKDAQ